MLVVAWLLGMVAGIFFYPLLVVVGAAATLVVVLQRVPSQLLVTTFALVVLGGVFSHQKVVIIRQAQADCRFSDWAEGVISVQPNVKISSVDYTLQTSDGCRYFLTAGVDPAYRLGDVLKAQGDWQAVQEIAEKNPGYAQYLMRRGIAGVVRYPTLTLMVAAEHSSSVRQEWVRVKTQQLFAEPEASLALAMIFNQVGLIPPDIAEQFRMTGITHILAISGSNITLLAGLLYAVSLMFPIPGWMRALLISAFLWGYVLFIGWPISAVRAVFFWTLALFGLHLRALVGFGTVLLLTVVMMVTLDPLVLQDIGFQLSVAAVCGIAIAMLIARRLPRDYQKFGWLDVLAVTGGAFLATWPISAYHFGTFSVSSLIANVLVVPIISFMYTVMVVVLIGSLVPGVGLVGAFVVHLLWRISVFFIDPLSRLLWGYVENVHMPSWVLFLYYLLLIGFATFLLHKQQRTWRELWS